MLSKTRRTGGGPLPGPAWRRNEPPGSSGGCGWGPELPQGTHVTCPLWTRIASSFHVGTGLRSSTASYLILWEPET